MKYFYLTVACAVLSCNFASAQYCTSGGPSSTVDSNVQLVKIIGQSDSIVHIGCPGHIGVENLTNLSTTLNAGNTYTLKVQFGTCNGNYLGSGEIWIDYDQSQSFDPWESVGTWTGTPPVPLSVYSVTVPFNAHNGPTRMRVMQREGNVTPPLDPCSAYSWGSVMDFTIIIAGGIDCSAYIGDDRQNPVIVSSYPYSHNNSTAYCYSNRNPAYPSPDVFYRVTPSAGSFAMHATLCGSSFDTFISVIDAQGNVIAYNDDSPTCAPQSEMTFSTVGLDTAFVIVEGWGTDTGSYTLLITEDLVGVNELHRENFRIIPNPATDQIVLSGTDAPDIEILDLRGSICLSIHDYHGEPISTQTLLPGIYFVRLDMAGNYVSQKLIITE